MDACNEANLKSRQEEIQQLAKLEGTCEVTERWSGEIRPDVDAQEHEKLQGKEHCKNQRGTRPPADKQLVYGPDGEAAEVEDQV
jgi:hypothetical protein